MTDSDYTKPQTNIYEELPAVLQNELNRSLIETTFNRQLSKTEVDHKYGIIGTIASGSNGNKHLPEDTPHQQAYQLQPVMYSKVATVDHVSSYADVLNRLEILGVDVDRLKKWGDTEQFNFAPPICFDKLINYRDYVWYDPSSSNITPQYITIESACSFATAKYQQKLRNLGGFDSPQLISSVTSATKTFRIVSDYTNVFVQGLIFEVVDSFPGSPVGINDGLYTTVSSSFVNGRTEIIVEEAIPDDSFISGSITFENILLQLKNEVSLVCTGGLGWDTVPWDDFVNNNYWDAVGATGIQFINPWSYTNKWVHKSNLPPGVFIPSARAKGPILEYSSFLQLNQWSETKYTWKHRTSISAPWNISITDPTVSDITSPTFLDLWCLSSTADTVATGHQSVNGAIITATTNLPPGQQTLIRNSPTEYEIVDAVIPPTIEDSFLHQAIVGSQDIRVFVDGVQQFGNYTEMADGNNEFVVGIEFFEDQSASAIIDVQLNAAAASDVGREYAYVRHIENDSDWADYLADNTLMYRSLIRYRVLIQEKLQSEIKYPLFDIYDVHGNTTNIASPIFIFKESPEAPVVNHLNLRVVIGDDNNYHFEQLLIDEDDGKMSFYKQDSTISVENPEGLQSIWKIGNERYVPRFVDENRREDGEQYYDENYQLQTAVVTPVNGDWELAEQLFFNASHKNKRNITYRELFSHGKDIIEQQQMPTGIAGNAKEAAVLLDSAEFDFGTGGTIKEFNDSYDSLLSSLYINNNNPLTVVEFAQNQYEQLLNYIKEKFRADVYGYMLHTTPESMDNQDSYIAESIINDFELNDNFARIYGDSTTYNAATNKGIKNWVATLPYVRMHERVYPVKLVDPELNINQLRHHDSHLSIIALTQSSITSLQKAIIRTVIDQGTGRKRGWQDTVPADGGVPTTRALVDFNRLLPNDYWLETNGDFYRFEVYHVGSNAPQNSSSIPNGVLWLDTDVGILFEKNGSGWTQVPGSPGNLDAAWKKIDFVDMLMNVMLTVELKLYDAAPTLTSADVIFKREQYVLDGPDETSHNEYTEDNFLQFTRELYISDPFATDYIATNPFTWNYGTITAANSPNATLVADFWSSRWHTIYQNIFNTPYPHLEPWKLQNFPDKPTWWDTEYADPSGARRWLPVMWTNIQAGTVPGAYTAPATVPTYTFVSVNTTNNSTSDGYAPDDLLPPFWNPPTLSANDQAVKDMVFLRSSLATFNGVDFAAKYPFGTQGPIEWRWRNTTNYLYGEMTTAFKLQPVRYTHYTLGIEFINIGGLQIEKDTSRVYSHRDVIFHGEADLENNIKQFPGTLQWYSNFNRVNSYDSLSSNFKTLWNSWEPVLAYNFGSLIDVKTLDIGTKTLELLSEDRSVVFKRSPSILDVWLDALTITVGQFGRSIPKDGYKIPHDGGHDWTYIVDTPATTTRTVEYYTAQNYIFTVADAATGLLSCTQPIPFVTGDEVRLTTTVTLPEPLTQSGTFFIVKASPTSFYLTDTYEAATADTPSVYTYENAYESGEQRVTGLKSTFLALGGSSTTFPWRHHKLNTTEILTTNFPFTIRGTQQLVDFIDGYSKRLIDNGFTFNHTSLAQLDGETGRIIDWQFEIEKAIDVIYTGLGVNNTPTVQQGKTYQFTASNFSDTLTVVGLNVPFEAGQEVFVYTHGTIPSPLLLNTPYYIIRVTGSNDQFRLATSKEEALQGVSINVLTDGVGMQFIGSFNQSSAVKLNTHQINPFKHNVWVKTPKGVVSNMVDGPYSDVKTDQTLFDQYGRPFNKQSIHILRHDTFTRISVDDDIPNDNYSGGEDTVLMIGGMHLFIDGYEHVLLFNNYSTEGVLLYDDYLGLNTPRFLIEYYSQSTDTLRPVVGGYVIDDQGKMTRNMEGSVEDMQLYYDTFISNENSDFISYARRTIGYDTPDYLDYLGVTDKSKFLFWKGSLQTKGSQKAINAFINSIQFIDAKVDEFWAYKIGEFGDNREKSYPALRIQVNDVRRDDIKYHFTDGTGADAEFDEIKLTQPERWVDLPTIAQQIATPTFRFDSEITTRTDYRILVVGSPYAIEKYNTELESWEVIGATDVPYIILDTHCDHIEVTVSAGTLLPAEIVQINGKIVQIPTITASCAFTIYTKNAAKSALNPSLIIDSSNNTTVRNIPMWDPVKHIHLWSAYHAIDFDTAVNPVDSLSTDTAWTKDYVGTTWLDTSKLGYYPYYDQVIFPTIREQLFNWGKLADWASLTVWQWVKSTVPPSGYAALAATQGGDASIPDNEKASGIPRQVLQKSLGGSPTVWANVDVSSELHLDWYAAFPQPTITWPASAEISIYVNGSRFVNNTLTVQQLTTLYGGDLSVAYNTITGDTLTNVDTVHIVRNVTAADISNNLFKYVDEFITVESVASNNIDPEFAYYFWVEQRAVVTGNKSMSAKDAQTQLIVPNIPYQIFRKSEAVSTGLPVPITPLADVVLYVTLDLAGVNASSPQMVGSVTINTQPTDIITISYPVGAPYKAWSPWDDDNNVDIPGSPKLPWTCKIAVTTADQVVTEYHPDFYLNDDDALDAASDIVLTGSTSYHISLPTDTNASDNRGGVSLIVTKTPVPVVYVPEDYYDQLIVRRMKSTIDAENRYVIRFTRDFTLRASLEDNVSGSNRMLKNVHTQWDTFRRQANKHPPSALWDKVTETVIGYDLLALSEGSYLPVPSYDRVLYDEQFGTTTRFGLLPGQAMTDPVVALNTVLSVINDPSFDPTPINKFDFLETEDFTTPEGIRDAMDLIYATFPSKSVNQILFEVILDSMTLKREYPDLFKTSWIAIHGIKLLETGDSSGL